LDDRLDEAAIDERVMAFVLDSEPLANAGSRANELLISQEADDVRRTRRIGRAAYAKAVRSVDTNLATSRPLKKAC